MRVFGKGFNFSQDGPGNRLVYHLSGCNMRCIWCSNPEGMDGVAGKDMSAEDILAECISAEPMFFGGGGVTFTGGEATLWHAELIPLLAALRRHGIRTAIETNATSEHFASIVSEVDYLIMDFKHYDSAVHERFTGVSNSAVKANFEYVCGLSRQAHVRIPLINGFNTDSPRAFAEYFSAHNTENVVFEFLPYHEYGKEKWHSEYLVKDGFIGEHVLKSFIEIFKEYGLSVINT